VVPLPKDGAFGVEVLIPDTHPTTVLAYAVMSFGGFLGIGESYHPLPWRILSYDTALGGYVVDLDRRRLEGAPTYTPAEEPDWRTYPERIDAYYAIPPV
jgi:hypothetical protein